MYKNKPPYRSLIKPQRLHLKNGHPRENKNKTTTPLFFGSSYVGPLCPLPGTQAPTTPPCQMLTRATRTPPRRSCDDPGKKTKQTGGGTQNRGCCTSNGPRCKITAVGQWRSLTAWISVFSDLPYLIKPMYRYNKRANKTINRRVGLPP